MPDREKVINGLRSIKTYLASQAIESTDDFAREGFIESQRDIDDAIDMLKEQDEEHRRLLSWLGKFCRHIDNGDAWLTDEENIAFFKEKMKQQFGWDTD